MITDPESFVPAVVARLHETAPPQKGVAHRPTSHHPAWLRRGRAARRTWRVVLRRHPGTE